MQKQTSTKRQISLNSPKIASVNSQHYAHTAWLIRVPVCCVELNDLRDTVQVERYQDQAQAMLREHSLSVASSRPPARCPVDSPLLPAGGVTPGQQQQSAGDPHNRFGRLLLVLPLLKTVKPRVLELAFFRGSASSPLGGSTAPPLPVERLLCEMFKNW